MKLVLFTAFSLFASLATAAPVDIVITRHDGLTSIHHAQSRKPLNKSASATPVTLEGELELLHEDDFTGKGTGAWHYHVRSARGERTALNVDSLPRDAVHPHDHVLVRGKKGTRGTSLDPSLAALDPTNITVLSAPTPLALGQGWTGNVPILIAFIQYNGAPSSNPGFAGSPQAQAAVDRLVRYYYENSYGLVTLQPVITSLVNVNWSSPNGLTCDTGVIYGGSYPMGGANGALKAANPMWDLTQMLTGVAVPGVPAYKDVIYVMPQSSCGWKGLANVGGYNAWIAGAENFYDMPIRHELGHNFGTWHAGNGGGLPPSMWGVTEYGDPYSCMGSNGACGHFSAGEKRASLGWISPAHSTTYALGSGSKTITIDPLEETGGQFYEVVMPTSNSLVTYSVEYRKSTGFDAGMPDALYIHLVRPFTSDAVAGSDDTVLLSDRIVGVGQTVALTDGASVTFNSPGPAPPPPSNNLFVNGGFENPAISGSGYQYQPPNTPGWVFAGGAGVQTNGSPWGAPSAPDGTQTAFVQDLGSISQTLSLNVGTYTLKLQAAQRTSYCLPVGSCLNAVNITLDGALIGTVSPTSGSFANFGFQVSVGVAGPHTFAFTGTQPQSVDRSTFIDSVTLQ